VNTILTAGPVRPICSPTTSLHDFENIPRQVCPPTTSLHVSENIQRQICFRITSLHVFENIPRPLYPTTSRHLFESIQMLVCPPTTSRQHNIIRGSLNFLPLQCTGDTLKIFRIRYVILTRAVISLKIFRARDVQFFSFIIEFNYYWLIIVPPQTVDQGYL
jgi:hypothetical protein